MAFQIAWTKPTTAIEASLMGQPLSIMEFESPSAALIAEPVSFVARSMVYWISGLFFATLVVGYYAQLDVVIAATGKVVSVADTVVIQPLDISIIKSIDVRVGQVVHKGDLLATLDSTLTAADVTAYKAAVAELTPMLERLHDEQAGREYKPKDPKDPNQALQLKQFQERKALVLATAQQYNQQIESLEQQISGNLASAQYYRARLGLANDVETLRRDEEKLQVGSKLNSLMAADTRVQMEASMQEAIASAQSEKGQLQSTIGQRDAAVATFNAATAQSVTDNTALLDTAHQNLDKAALHGGLVQMRAPEDGVILQVEKLSIGSVITPGEQFIQITPLDKPLEVEVYVSGADVGWVLKGDYTEIQFDTFMYQEYGDARGHVTSVGYDSFLAPSGSATSGPIVPSTGTGAPGGSPAQATSMTPMVSVYYVVRSTIDKLQLRNVPKNFRMVPGLPVGVDIKVGTRSYVEYMLARIMTIFHEAMREP